MSQHIQYHCRASSSELTESTTNTPLTALTVQIKANTLSGSVLWFQSSCRRSFLSSNTSHVPLHLHLINRLSNATRRQDEVETIPVTSPPRSKTETCFQGCQEAKRAGPISAASGGKETRRSAFPPHNPEEKQRGNICFSPQKPKEPTTLMSLPVFVM